MSIRAIYFDFGGVLVRTEDRQPRTTLAESLGLTYEGIESYVFGGGADGSSVKAMLGQITEEEHWQNVIRHLNLPAGRFDEVREAFFAGDRVDRQLVETLRRLQKDYQVGLISNAWSGLRAYIESQQFDDAFHHMVISAEIGMAKPDERIYRHALEKFGVAAEESVFVDDFIENIEACRAIGMHGIHFRTAEQALGELEKILANHS